MRETALAPARAVFALVRLITVLHEKSLVRLKFLNILPVVLQVSYKTVSDRKKSVYVFMEKVVAIFHTLVVGAKIFRCE